MTLSCSRASGALACAAGVTRCSAKPARGRAIDRHHGQALDEGRLRAAKSYAVQVSRAAVTVVSWNVNSLRARLPLVLRSPDERAPDVICLQETRLAAAKLDFPA